MKELGRKYNTNSTCSNINNLKNPFENADLEICIQELVS